jgi:hypothetical protein
MTVAAMSSERTPASFPLCAGVKGERKYPAITADIMKITLSVLIKLNSGLDYIPFNLQQWIKLFTFNDK